MVILPIGDENPRVRLPLMHYVIMAVNVAVFIYMFMLPERELGELVDRFALFSSPDRFEWHQFVTSIFLHAGPLHLGFNMLFLWIVGDNVEDRLGHVGYLFFYIVVGVVGGAVHMATVFGTLSAAKPCVGASGAVSGVMAAYVVFFPNARIKIFYWVWWIVNVIYVSAKWAIGFWIAQQVLLYFLVSNSGVAYGAHVGGFMAGLLIALAARSKLKPYDPVGRILGAEPTESAWTQEASWQQPPDYVFTQEQPPPVVEPVEPVGVTPKPETSVRSGLKEQLAHAVNAGQTAEALHIYDRLSRYGGPVLSAGVLLRLAHLLVEHTEYDRAVRIYEDYLKHYPLGEQAVEVAFRVGMIHSRNTRDYVRARTPLERAARNHPNVNRRKRAVDEIRRVDSFLRSTFIGRSRPEGLCTIIRQSDEKINVAGVAELVVKVTGAHLADASRRLFNSRGIVAAGVPAQKAFMLANRVQDMNVPVLVVPDRDVATIEPPEDIRRIHLSAAGVKFDLVGDKQLVKTWEEIELFSVGIVQESRKVSHEIYHQVRIHDVKGVWAMGTPADHDEIVTRQGKDSLVVDVFVVSEVPPRHLRGREGKFRYRSEDGSGMDTRQRQFGRFVSAAFEHAPKLTTNIGAHREASGARGSKRAYTFQNFRDFDEYNRWWLTLCRHQPELSGGLTDMPETT